MSEKMTRRLIDINGIVQGVGFRPFVYKLARSCAIKGWVNNYPGGVHIDAEGAEESMKSFLERLRTQAPPISFIDTFRVETGEPEGYTDFEIRSSSSENADEAFISADLSVCEDCVREMEDPGNRRYRYPFINCTNCGPRFTITSAIPYDRTNTTMRSFPMCGECAEEYRDPSNRRFHAQPVACDACGPSLTLLDRDGIRVFEGEEIEKTAELLKKGAIVAVKGLGGYHLACDAENSAAVRELRKRKNRDGKPFALMARDIETVQKHCVVGEREAELLKCPAKPIVLLDRKKESGLAVGYLSPDNGTLGIMLPYTPLHYLLLKDGPEILVMTSGNISGEPIYYKDWEALRGLRGIADYFLTNNREIYIRTDDSVVTVFRDRGRIVRRSRGYVPFPLDISAIFSETENSCLPSVLACGGELKNTFCITKGGKAYLSHHIGDLENMETLISFENGIEHFGKIFKIRPDAAAYDLHPEYLSTKYAEELINLKKFPIQHHRAHIASCMAENKVNGPVIGVAFDGTGYGDDGNVWGGEFFSGDYTTLERIAHFEYIPLPGGEAGIKEPWRMAVSYLFAAFGENFGALKLPFLKSIAAEKTDFVLQQIVKKVNSPLTSSAGRLFDAVSAILGLCNVIEYEGQAAIRLESNAEISEKGKYPYEITRTGTTYEISVKKMIAAIAQDVSYGTDIAAVAGVFHRTVAEIILEICSLLRKKTGINGVALSGGVFQNRLLLAQTLDLLESEGFTVYTHAEVPTNDGGISLGQAVIALKKYMEKKYE